MSEIGHIFDDFRSIEGVNVDTTRQCRDCLRPEHQHESIFQTQRERVEIVDQTFW